MGSLDQFSPAAGRAGRCRQMSLCVGSTRRALARQPAVLAPSPRVLHAFSLHGERPRQPGVCTHSTPGAVRLFPPRPQRAPPVGSQEVFRQKPGPVCRVGGGGFSGAEFAPCPSPCLLPPAGMGRLFSGVSQPVLQTASGVFLPVNFSLALPQFKKISLRLLSGPSGWSLP